MVSTESLTRSVGLGGSDMGAIVGCDPWRDQYSLWLEKYCHDFRREEPTPRMRWGKRLERHIVEEYELVTGRRTIWANDTRQHPLYPCIIWTPDAFCADEPRLIDAKLVAWDQRHHWGDTANDIPLQYQVQMQFYLHISGYPVGDIAALIDFQLYIYEIYRDPQIGAELMKRGLEWWDRHIVHGEEPPMGTSRATQEWLKQRFPRNTEPLRIASPAEIDLMTEYAEVRAAMKEGQKDKDLLEAKLKKACGDADGFYCDYARFTWKATKDTQVTDWETLARSLMTAIPDQEQARLIKENTALKPGYRRIYFHCDMEEANDD